MFSYREVNPQETPVMRWSSDVSRLIPHRICWIFNLAPSQWRYILNKVYGVPVYLRHRSNVWREFPGALYLPSTKVYSIGWHSETRSKARYVSGGPFVKDQRLLSVGSVAINVSHGLLVTLPRHLSLSGNKCGFNTGFSLAPVKQNKNMAWVMQP